METMVRIHAVDSATLTPLVRQALLSGDSEVIAWQVAPMHGGFGGGSGVSNLHRFTGSARDGDRIVPWSLVLKILRWTNGRAGSTGWQYWRREAEAYQSGLLRRLPGDLKAPRCFGAIEYPGEGIWLWLEDLSGAAATRWSPSRYGLAARHIGCAGYVNHP